MINVGPDARRFTDESQKTRHGHVYYNGEYFQQILFDEMYAIFDERAVWPAPFTRATALITPKKWRRASS